MADGERSFDEFFLTNIRRAVCRHMLAMPVRVGHKRRHGERLVRRLVCMVVLSGRVVLVARLVMVLRHMHRIRAWHVMLDRCILRLVLWMLWMLRLPRRRWRWRMVRRLALLRQLVLVLRRRLLVLLLVLLVVRALLVLAIHVHVLPMRWRIAHSALPPRSDRPPQRRPARPPGARSLAHCRSLAP